MPFQYSNRYIFGATSPNAISLYRPLLFEKLSQKDVKGLNVSTTATQQMRLRLIALPHLHILREMRIPCSKLVSGKFLFSIQLFKCLSFHKFCTPNVLPPAQLGQRLYRGRGQCSKTAEMSAVRSRFGRKWQRPKGRSFAIWVIQMEAARAIRCTTWSSCSHRIDLEDWKRHADMPKCHSVSVCTWQKLFGWMGISLPNRKLKSQGWWWSWRKLELQMYCHVQYLH